MYTSTHRNRSGRIRFSQICAVAALGCATSVLSVSTTASASEPGSLPPPAYDASAIECPLYTWYINHNATIDKPRGNQLEPDGRTPPRLWCGPLPRA